MFDRKFLSERLNTRIFLNAKKPKTLILFWATNKHESIEPTDNYAYDDTTFCRGEIANEVYELVYKIQRLAVWWNGTILIE